MPSLVRYREPVFTHDVAEKAWGKAYWALSGAILLDWIRTSKKGIIGLGVHAMYDHRRYFAPMSERCVCWAIKPKLGEIPKEIVETYEVEIDEYPSSLVTEESKEEYRLQKSWSHLMFKWDTMSVAPQKFNLLLAKLLSVADYNKLALAVLDTKDLYVNINPIEWNKKYDAPYPVEDLEAQKKVYEEWITYSGFKRLYLYEDKKLIATPWYYRIPPTETEAYGTSIQEYPEYKVHPLPVSGGTYYPPGYDEDNGEADV